MSEELKKYITAAQTAVYEPKRAKMYLPMLDTRQGSVAAVGSVMGALDAARPIPDEIRETLAVHIYMLMVDVAMNATGEKPDKAIMKQTISAIIDQLVGKKRPQQPQQPARPSGLLQGAM